MMATSIEWKWSPPHQRYYYYTSDVYGQPQCVWAPETSTKQLKPSTVSKVCRNALHNGEGPRSRWITVLSHDQQPQVHAEESQNHITLQGEASIRSSVESYNQWMQEVRPRNVSCRMAHEVETYVSRDHHRQQQLLYFISDYPCKCPIRPSDPFHPFFNGSKWATTRIDEGSTISYRIQAQYHQTQHHPSNTSVSRSPLPSYPKPTTDIIHWLCEEHNIHHSTTILPEPNIRSGKCDYYDCRDMYCIERQIYTQGLRDDLRHHADKDKNNNERDGDNVGGHCDLVIYTC